MPRHKGTSQRSRGGGAKQKISKNPAVARSRLAAGAAVGVHVASARGRSSVRPGAPNPRSRRHSPCKKRKGSVGANRQPGLSDAPGAAKARKRMRSSREAAALAAENEKSDMIAAMNALPKDIGATALSRHATFAHDGRSKSAAQQAIAKRRRVSIDRARSAPGHGKRKVDGAHAVLKTLLREIMAMLDNGDERKPVIGAETHVEGEKRSFASACHASAVKHLSTCRCDTFGMNKKRQAEARTVAREFDLYTHQDVKAALPEYKYAGKFKTIDPSTKEERQQKLPYSSWKAFHNLRCDHQLPAGEARLRRWPCFCSPCKEQLALPSLHERYGASLACVMRPVFGSLNDWRKIAFEEVASRGEEPCQGCDGDEDDGDDLEDDEGEEEDDGIDETDELEDDEFAAAEYTDRLADDVEPGDLLAIPAPGDKKAAGHYILEAESTAYELTEDEESPDWGLLEAGTRVIDAFYWNIVGSPRSRPLWMTASIPPIRRKVPTHLLLLASFAMPIATGAKTKMQRDAVAMHARVVTEDVLDDIDQEVAVRASWEEE